MATLKEQMATDFKNIMLNTNEFAEASTYSFLSGATAKPVGAIWDYEESAIQFSESGKKLRTSAQVTLALEDIPSPVKHDTITNADSEVFVVDSIIRKDSAAITLQVINKQLLALGNIQEN